MIQLLQYILEAEADLDWHVLDLLVNRSKGKLQRDLAIGVDNARRRLYDEAEVLMNHLQHRQA